MTDEKTNAEPSGASGGSLANRTIQHNDEAAAEIMAQGIAKMIRICAEPDWISVTDRLPERNEPVLVVDESGVTVGTYSPMLDDWWSLHGDRLAPGPCVTHWMAFPAPPLESK